LTLPPANARDSRFNVYIAAFKLIESILSTHGRFGERCSMALNSPDANPQRPKETAVG
jgi:hypothetical protein